MSLAVDLTPLGRELESAHRGPHTPGDGVRKYPPWTSHPRGGTSRVPAVDLTPPVRNSRVPVMVTNRRRLRSVVGSRRSRRRLPHPAGVPEGWTPGAGMGSARHRNATQGRGHLRSGPSPLSGGHYQEKNTLRVLSFWCLRLSSGPRSRPLPPTPPAPDTPSRLIPFTPRHVTHTPCGGTARDFTLQYTIRPKWG